MTWLARRRKEVARVNEWCPDEKYTTTPIIAIDGERQTCKTEMVIERMVRHAREGVRVAYVGHNLKHAINTMHRIDARQEPDVAKVRRTHGCERIEFASGGVIHFKSKDGGRGLVLDVLVWDDVDKPISSDWMCTLVASPGPLIYKITANEEYRAKRALIAKLRDCVTGINDIEQARASAAYALLEYINDPEVTRLCAALDGA
jgi:hypothetical protein